MRFGVLRVLNQDRIAPDKGFSRHAHQDMEIVTYVLEGALRHEDSMGNGSEVGSGEVQLMSAGTGVTHSEFNASASDPLHLLQMWVLPEEKGTAPRYEQGDFRERFDGQLAVVATPDGEEGSMKIGQDVRLLAGRLQAGGAAEVRLDPGRRAWLHLALGKLSVNGLELGAGDGVAIDDETVLRLSEAEAADLVIWDLPAEVARSRMGA